MSEDFFTDPGHKETAAGERDPREYPIPEEWKFGKPSSRSKWDAGRHRSPHIFAIVLIFAGVLFFLNNLGFVHIGSIFEYWPLILIAVGLSKFSCSRGITQIWAVMVIGIGALFLARNLGLFWLNFNMLWPVALIGAGFFLLVNRGMRGAMQAMHHSFDEREISLFSFFGGVKRVMDTDDFRGGDALAIFGGVDVDLRLARMSGDVKEVIIDANALFGGINIKVPDNWRVAVRGIGVFGGYTDKTLRRKSDVKPDSPLLVITGYALFGGVEVHS